MANLEDEALLETSIALRDQWATYHHHKESTATNAALIYMGAAVTLPWGLPQISATSGKWAILSAFIVISTAAFFFTRWQFKNRIIGKERVGKCDDTIRAIIRGGPSDPTNAIRAEMFGYLEHPPKAYGPEVAEAWIYVGMSAAAIVGLWAIRERLGNFWSWI